MFKSVIITIALLHSSLIAQIDTTLSEYFPLEIGNYWEYRDNTFNLWKIEIIKDTTMINGHSYKVFKDSTDWIGGTVQYNYYRIDDSMRVWQYVQFNEPGSCNNEYLIFYLTREDSTLWNECISTNNPDPEHNYACLAWTRQVYYSTLNFQTTEKTFCGAVIDSITTDTSFCGSFYFGLYELAKGIGLTRRAAEAGNEIFITGAIINGIKYGTIVNIQEQINDPINNIEITNYPNPFNSSSKLRFSVDKASEVSIDIYNILGSKIENIFKGYFLPGIHERVIDSEILNICSGTYIINVTINKEIYTRKILLLK